MPNDGVMPDERVGKDLAGVVVVVRTTTREGAVLESCEWMPAIGKEYCLTADKFKANPRQNDWPDIFEGVTGEFTLCGCYHSPTDPFEIADDLGSVFVSMAHPVFFDSDGLSYVNQLREFETCLYNDEPSVSLVKALAKLVAKSPPVRGLRTLTLDSELLQKLIVSEVVRLQTIIPRVVPYGKSELDVMEETAAKVT